MSPVSVYERRNKGNAKTRVASVATLMSRTKMFALCSQPRHCYCNNFCKNSVLHRKLWETAIRINITVLSPGRRLSQRVSLKTPNEEISFTNQSRWWRYFDCGTKYSDVGLGFSSNTPANRETIHVDIVAARYRIERELGYALDLIELTATSFLSQLKPTIIMIKAGIATTPMTQLVTRLDRCHSLLFFFSKRMQRNVKREIERISRSWPKVNADCYLWYLALCKNPSSIEIISIVITR